MTFNELTPNLSVKDIRSTVDFYQNILGFSVVMAIPEKQDSIDQQLEEGKEYVYTLMTRDTVELMFQRSDSFYKDIELAKSDMIIGASASFYTEIDELGQFFQKIKNHWDQITEPKTTWYGMREFYVRDPNGYILGFAEKAET